MSQPVPSSTRHGHPATPHAPSSTAAPAASALAQWDARLRLLALLALAFAFSAVRQWQAVPLMLLIAAASCWLAALPVRALLQRLRLPSILVAGMALAVLLRHGPTPWLRIGSLTLSAEGAQAAALLLARVYGILTLAFACFHATPLLRMIDALRALRLPYILVDMALLMARYLETLKQDLHHMQLAARLRGFRQRGWSMHTLKTQSWLAANLLLRSYERADGIYQAMRLRGYGLVNPHGLPPPRARDWLCFTAALALAAALFWLG